MGKPYYFFNFNYSIKNSFMFSGFRKQIAVHKSFGNYNEK